MATTNTTDEMDMAVRARAGDRKALASLVELARVRLFPVAYAELRHYDDAQDAVASALLQICLHLGSLRDPARLRAWMYSIVRNEARRLVRGRLPQAPDFSLEQEMDLAPALPTSLLRIDIERALYRLPWDEARTVALFYLKGQSIREIASYLRRPEGTVKRWLHLGRRQLARELEAYAPMRPSTRRGVRRSLVSPVAGHSTRFAADPAANRVYILEEDGVLAIRDAATREGIATVQCGKRAFALAVNATLNRVYVAHSPASSDQFCGELSIIDSNTAAVIGRVEVGNSPRAVAVNPVTGHIYVVCAGDETVVVVDGETNTILQSIPVGSEPLSVGVNPVTNKIYVCNWGSCTVSVLDGSTGRVLRETPVGSFPVDVAVHPGENRVYVANSEDGTISVIGGADDHVIETLPVERPPLGLALDPSRNELYVSHPRPRARAGKKDSDTAPKSASAESPDAEPWKPGRRPPPPASQAAWWDRSAISILTTA